MRHSRYVLASSRQPSAWLAFSFRHAKYCSFTCTRRAHCVLSFVGLKAPKAPGCHCLCVWAPHRFAFPEVVEGEDALVWRLWLVATSATKRATSTHALPAGVRIPTGVVKTCSHLSQTRLRSMLQLDVCSQQQQVPVKVVIE